MTLLVESIQITPSQWPPHGVDEVRGTRLRSGVPEMKLLGSFSEETLVDLLAEDREERTRFVRLGMLRPPTNVRVFESSCKFRKTGKR